MSAIIMKKDLVADILQCMDMSGSDEIIEVDRNKSTVTVESETVMESIVCFMRLMGLEDWTSVDEEFVDGILYYKVRLM